MGTVIEQINSIGQQFVEFAGPMLIQSSVLILILLIVDFALRKKVRAVFRYWIWMLVLVKLVLPTSLSSPISLGYWLGDRLPTVDIRPNNMEPERVEPAPMILPPIIDLTNFDVSSYTPPVEPVLPVAEPVAFKPIAPPEAPATPVKWQGVAFLAWLAIGAAMALLLLQRALFVRGLVAQARKANRPMSEALEECRTCIGVRRKVGLKVSPNATTPAVCGLFRPVILVPQNLRSSLDSRHLRTVLLHELAHIKRGDLWMNLAQTALQIIYFYNPLLWLANAIIRRVREQAVDEAVLVAMGDKAQQYPQTLVDVAKLAFKQPALSLRLIGVVESKGALAARIKHILSRPMPKSAKLGILGLLAVLISAAILLPMAAAGKDEEGTVKDMSEGSQFTATLADGVTVELIGLCEVPNSGDYQNWWKPDGSPLENRPFRRSTCSVKQYVDRKWYCFAYSISSSGYRRVIVENNSGSGSGMLIDEHGDNIYSSTLDHVLSLLPAELNTTEMAFGFQGGPWKTLVKATDKPAEISFEGKHLKVTPVQLEDGKLIVRAYEEFRKSIKDKHVGFGLIIEEDGKETIKSLDRFASDVTDDDEKGIREETYEIDLTHYDDITTGTIKGTCIRYFPIQFVTFRNVSLRPGSKTDVQVEIRQALKESDIQDQVLSFGPEVKRILGLDCAWIDLESGTTQIPPSEESSNEAQLQWCRESGVDVVGRMATGRLDCLDVEMVKLDDRAWTGLSVDGLSQELKGDNSIRLSNIDGFPAVGLNGKSEKGTTYGFRTREGTLGLLKIDDLWSLEDGPRKDNPNLPAFITILYKLALSPVMAQTVILERPLSIGEQQYLDLDSGEYVFVPGENVNPEHLKNQGVDIYLVLEKPTPSAPPTPTLNVLGMATERAPHKLYLEQVPANSDSLSIAIAHLNKPQRLRDYGAHSIHFFRTAQGKAGVMRVNWPSSGEPSKCLVRYRLLPALDLPIENFPWGLALEGVQCRVRARKTICGAGEIPILSLDLRNRGKEAIDFVSVAQAHCEIQIDGAWYGWAEPIIIDAPVRRLEPATELNDAISIKLTNSWALPRNTNKLKHLPGVAEFWGKRLELTPGRHTVRVRFRTDDWLQSYMKNESSLSVVSNPVEITIERALPGSGLSIDEAIKEEAAFAAVCEAVEESVHIRSRTPPGVSPMSQVFKVVEILFGKAEAVDRVKLNYKYLYKEPECERAIRKHERVIWIGHTRNMSFHGSLYGLKALPDSPENRQAVKAAASQAATAAWGEAVNGLRAAVEFVPEKESYVIGERVEIHHYVQNVSDGNIQIASTTWRQDHAFATDANGHDVQVDSTWFSGWPRIVRHVLKPGETVALDSSGLGFGDADDPALVKDLNKRPVIGNLVRCEPGQYFIYYRVNLPDLKRQSHVDEKDNVPQPGDWRGVLETGRRNVTITPMPPSDPETFKLVLERRSIRNAILEFAQKYRARICFEDIDYKTNPELETNRHLLTGTFSAPTIPELLDKLIEGSPFTSERLSGTYVVYPKDKSLLRFPIQIDISQTLLESVVRRILDQDPYGKQIDIKMVSDESRPNTHLNGRVRRLWISSHHAMYALSRAVEQTDQGDIVWMLTEDEGQRCLVLQYLPRVYIHSNGEVDALPSSKTDVNVEREDEHAGVTEEPLLAPSGRPFSKDSQSMPVIKPHITIEHKDGVDTVLFSPGGESVISKSFSDVIKICDTLTGGLLRTLPLRGYSANSVALSQDGAVLAMGTNTGKVHLWNMQTLRLEKAFPVTKWSIYAIALSPNDEMLASCAADGTVQLWDIENSRQLETLGKKGAYRMSSMSFSPDSNVLVTLSRDGRADMWDVADRKLIGTVPTGADCWGSCSITFCPDQNTVAIATPGLVQLWKPENNNELLTINVPDSINPWKALDDVKPMSKPIFVGMVVLSPDCEKAASVIKDGTIAIWDVLSRIVEQKLIGSCITDLGGGGMRTMAFSPDKKLFASGNKNGKVQLWKLADLKKQREALNSQ